MEDDLEAQLMQQLAEVWRLRAEKERREREARLKAEREAKEKAAREARKRAKREAQERERWENKYRAWYQEGQRWKHEAAAQQVAEAKQLQRQVRMLEASGSGRNRDVDVSSPSPSPTYIRLIRKQVARVSYFRTDLVFCFNGNETGKSWGHLEGPLWRMCHPRRVLRP